MLTKAVYEALPYGYTLVGLGSLISVENDWGKLCGIILIVIGFVIHQLRTRYRSQERKLRRKPVNRQLSLRRAG